MDYKSILGFTAEETLTREKIDAAYYALESNLKKKQEVKDKEFFDIDQLKASAKEDIKGLRELLKQYPVPSLINILAREESFLKIVEYMSERAEIKEARMWCLNELYGMTEKDKKESSKPAESEELQTRQER